MKKLLLIIFAYFLIADVKAQNLTSSNLPMIIK